MSNEEKSDVMVMAFFTEEACNKYPAIWNAINVLRRYTMQEVSVEDVEPQELEPCVQVLDDRGSEQGCGKPAIAMPDISPSRYQSEFVPLCMEHHAEWLRCMDESNASLKTFEEDEE